MHTILKMRIWAKIINNDKILSDIIMNFDVKLTEKIYTDCLIKLCHKLDIPTPITLKYHYKCFDEFNTVKYKSDDFVEHIDFTSLILENCIEK